MKSSSSPRPPIPMWHNESRSLAPAILLYESAVPANAAPPASSAADLLKNVFRSMVSFASLISPPRNFNRTTVHPGGPPMTLDAHNDDVRAGREHHVAGMMSRHQTLAGTSADDHPRI